MSPLQSILWLRKRVTTLLELKAQSEPDAAAAAVTGQVLRCSASGRRTDFTFLGLKRTAHSVSR